MNYIESTFLKAIGGQFEMRPLEPQRSANRQPPVNDARGFFAVTTNLGWKVMGERLRCALEESHASGQHRFRAFTLPELVSKFTWSANYSDSERVPFPLLDPHLSFRLASSSIRREAVPFDFSIAATSPLAAAFLASSRGKPVMQFVDGTRDIFRRDFGIDNISDAAIEREKQHFQAVRHTFALSNWVKQNIVDVYEVPPDKVTVVPPLSQRISTDIINRPRRDRLQIAFVGGDFARKGGRNLLVWQAKHLHRFADLHIVTDDRWRDESIPATKWYGPLNNQLVVDSLLPAVDVLCHPTTRDCSAIVVVEAAALGIPSVASSIGGIPDLIEHGRTGFLARHEEGEAFMIFLEKLHNDRDFLEKMSRAALEKARMYFAPDKVLNLIMSRLTHALT